MVQLLVGATANHHPNKQQIRNLNVHEYISYTLLRDHGIPVPKFNVATTKEEVVKFAKELNSKDIVLKAQVIYKVYYNRKIQFSSKFSVYNTQKICLNSL